MGRRQIWPVVPDEGNAPCSELCTEVWLPCLAGGGAGQLGRARSGRGGSQGAAGQDMLAGRPRRQSVAQSLTRWDPVLGSPTPPLPWLFSAPPS